MQVGMDPTVVQQREGTLRAEAAQAVNQVQSQKQEGSDHSLNGTVLHTPNAEACRFESSVDGYREPTGPSIGGAQETWLPNFRNHMSTAQHAPPTVPPIAPESRNGAVNEQELMRL